MPRSVGDRLPDALQRACDGTDLAGRVGFTLSLMTTDEGGWPHAALLSVGEVLARDERRLGLALWPSTSTTRTLTRAGQATLSCVLDGSAWSVHLRARRDPDLSAGGMDHACFEATVEEVLQDVVTYARLTSGVTFDLPDPASVVERWERTIEALRERAASWPA